MEERKRAFLVHSVAHRLKEVNNKLALSVAADAVSGRGHGLYGHAVCVLVCVCVGGGVRQTDRRAGMIRTACSVSDVSVCVSALHGCVGQTTALCEVSTHRTCLRMALPVLESSSLFSFSSSSFLSIFLSFSPSSSSLLLRLSLSSGECEPAALQSPSSGPALLTQHSEPFTSQNFNSIS